MLTVKISIFFIVLNSSYPEPNPANQPDIRQERLQGQSGGGAPKKHKRQPKHQQQPMAPPQPPMHSYSSSEEDLKSTPEYGSDSEKGKRSFAYWFVLCVVVYMRLLLPFKQFYLVVMMMVNGNDDGNNSFYHCDPVG